MAFARLALNPSVLDYHPRSAIAIWNWYLYAYGIVTACLFVGAKLLRGRDHVVGWSDHGGEVADAIEVIAQPAKRFNNSHDAYYSKDGGERSMRV